jgi:LPXTG-motif cell wall-anchored protein
LQGFLREAAETLQVIAGGWKIYLFLHQNALMIQRIQTVYLLLAAILGAVISFYNPNLWRAKLVNNAYQYFTGQSSYLYFALMMIIILLAVVCIFLFRKRKLQFRLTVLNIILSLGIIALQYFKINTEALKLQGTHLLASSTYLPAAFLPIVIVVLLFLAARGIYKDERLVKSLNRLR